MLTLLRFTRWNGGNLLSIAVAAGHLFIWRGDRLVSGSGHPRPTRILNPVQLPAPTGGRAMW